MVGINYFRCHGYDPRQAGIVSHHPHHTRNNYGLGTCPDGVEKCVGWAQSCLSFWIKESLLWLGIWGRGLISSWIGNHPVHRWINHGSQNGTYLDGGPVVIQVWSSGLGLGRIIYHLVMS
jgi:hypothetical protein